MVSVDITVQVRFELRQAITEITLEIRHRHTGDNASHDQGAVSRRPDIHVGAQLGDAVTSHVEAALPIWQLVARWAREFHLLRFAAFIEQPAQPITHNTPKNHHKSLKAHYVKYTIKPLYHKLTQTQMLMTAVSRSWSRWHQCPHIIPSPPLPSPQGCS